MFSGCLCICANCASVLHPGGGSPDGLQSNSSFIVILSLLFMCFPTPVSSCTLCLKKNKTLNSCP